MCKKCCRQILRNANDLRATMGIPTTELYFESHITIEPVYGERLEKLTKIVQEHKFRVADLLMQKRPENTAERSKYDTFCTAKDTSYQRIFTNAEKCVEKLIEAGFVVWRVKIENTLLDEKLPHIHKSNK